jgi:ferredoxin
VDAEKMDALFRHWIDPASVDTAFICGPEPMMLTIAESLRQHGLTDDRIKFELFASSQPGRAKKKVVSKQAAEAGAMCEAQVTLDGATRTFRMPKDGTPVLQAALDNAMDAPFSCRAGVCSTCRAKVLEGEVEMETNHALEDYEVRAGYVLTCQCVPISDTVVITSAACAAPGARARAHGTLTTGRTSCCRAHRAGWKVTSRAHGARARARGRSCSTPRPGRPSRASGPTGSTVPRRWPTPARSADRRCGA